MSVAVSIIIPVYNGAFYLNETLLSLRNQNCSDFEVICVDDSSTDNSLEILQSFAKKDSRVKVFTKPNGGTAAKAIMYGLKFATGKYFMYSSQDDLYSSDLLEKNLLIAETLNADAVVPDMVLFWGKDKLGKGIVGIKGDRSQVINGREALILSLDWTIHGFVLWDMNTVRKVGFFDFSINSDEYTTRALYFYSKRVAFSEGVFYYRQNNVNAITKKWSIKQLECFTTSNKLEEFLIKNDFDNEVVSKANEIILIDLFRIQIMFLDNKDFLDLKQRIEARNGIRKAYYDNVGTLKTIKYQSFKHACMKEFVSLGFKFFLLFTFVYRGYLRFLDGK